MQEEVFLTCIAGNQQRRAIFNQEIDGALNFSQADPHELAEKVVEIVGDFSLQHQLRK